MALAAVPALAYLIIAVLVAFDAIIPAVPSEVALVTAGTLVATGELGVGWAIVAAVAGALAGDCTMHTVGRRALPGALGRSRLGRRVHRSVAHAYSRMGSASAGAIIVGRFVPLGRTASAAAAGLAGMSRSTFLLYSAAGGTAWAAWMIGIGFSAGSVVDAPIWQQSLIAAGIALVVGVWITTIHTVVRTRRRMSARVAPATGDTGTAAAATARATTVELVSDGGHAGHGQRIGDPARTAHMMVRPLLSPATPS